MPQELDTIFNYLILYFLLIMSGIILLVIRPDSQACSKELQGYLKNLPIRSATLIFLLFLAIVPFTIPFSIAKILNSNSHE